MDHGTSDFPVRIGVESDFADCNYHYRKHKKFDGEIFLMYLWGYGMGRVWVEGLRSDSLMIPFINMKVSQLLAAICVLVCSVIIVKNVLKQ